MLYLTDEQIEFQREKLDHVTAHGAGMWTANPGSQTPHSAAGWVPSKQRAPLAQWRAGAHSGQPRGGILCGVGPHASLGLP